VTTHPHRFLLIGALDRGLLPGCTSTRPEARPPSVTREPTPQQGAPPYEDRPIDATGDEYLALDEAMRPYVEEARRTYPEARARALAGLPPGAAFYVTTRLSDGRGRFEQVFVAVRGFASSTEGGPGVVWGDIASEIRTVEGYELGQEVTVREADILDWTIVHADGQEEGNVVGKFLDTYEPGR